MILQVKRRYNRDGYCIGHLYINGGYFCDTLEDVDRLLDDSMTAQKIVQLKVKGRTAIPTGKYYVSLAVKSPKFSTGKYASQYNFCRGYLPRLLNVKGYDGVLIHIGNSASDTDGCLLVGENKVKGKVINSTAMFKKLYSVLSGAKKKGETITIEITRAYR